MKRVLRQDRPQGVGRGCKVEQSATTTHRPQGARQAAYPLRVLVPLLLIVALMAIAVAGYWLKRPAEAQAVACVDPLAGCAFSHHGTAVQVVFLTPPTPLEAFALSISAPGVSKISAEFQMNGMEMGFNRYDLHLAENGTLAAKVTLPVCVSGRHDWTMYLDVDGTRYALPFSTQ